jgi:predicted NBD/HSP70 family sugar kinase
VGLSESRIESAPVGLRRLNRLRVIEALYECPATSRAELARRTGLSRATISALLDDLMRAGLVAEHDAAEEVRPRSTGRPPILLSLVPDAGYAVGLDLGHQHIRVAVCDLAGAVVVDAWSPAEIDHEPVESLDLAQELVREALHSVDVDRDRLLGVGMGLAAPINKVTGELEADGILPGWHGIRPAAEMERRLGVPVLLENDANAGALGENMFGAGRGVDDMVYIRLSAGIGAGLILGGRPYQGVRGVAGEIGHVIARENGRICRCGNRGCLETVASPVAVAAMLEPHTASPLSIRQLVELVELGDRGARRAVADAGEAVGRALSTLVNILNPELVVVGGDLAAAGDFLLGPLEAAIERHALAAAAASTRVTVGALGDRAEVLGAAALILARSPLALAQRLVEVR